MMKMTIPSSRDIIGIICVGLCRYPAVKISILHSEGFEIIKVVLTSRWLLVGSVYLFVEE